MTNYTLFDVFIDLVTIYKQRKSKMNIQYIELLSGFVGVLIGSSIPIFYEIRKEKKSKKKKLNSILFALIDLYFRISQMGSVFEAANNFNTNNKELEKIFLAYANDNKLDKKEFELELKKRGCSS